MNVLLLNHFPLEGSGSGTYTLNVAHHLAKRGHKVCAIFPESAQPSPFDGVELRPVYFDGAAAGEPGAHDGSGTGADALPFDFPCFTTHPRSLNTFGSLQPGELEAYLGAFRRVIADAVRDFKPDIIHAQHIWFLAALALETDVPCVVTAHGTDLMGFRSWPQFRDMARDVVEKCSRIICISRDNLNAALECLPQAEPKLQLLMNGYNEDVFYTEDIDRAALLAEHGIAYDGEQIVLFAGKLTGFKGVDTLLRAAAIYGANEAPDAEAEDTGGMGASVLTLLAGNGEKWDELHALADELALRNLHFLGHQSQADLRHLYNAADVFAMPSRREPFGLVALEAMACGLGVVASNEGGLPEFVAPEVGALVDVDDYEALAREVRAELRRRAADPASRKEAIAQRTFDTYAQSKFIVKLEALYDEVLSNG